MNKWIDRSTVYLISSSITAGSRYSNTHDDSSSILNIPFTIESKQNLFIYFFPFWRKISPNLFLFVNFTKIWPFCLNCYICWIWLKIFFHCYIKTLYICTKSHGLTQSEKERERKKWEIYILWMIKITKP